MNSMNQDYQWGYIKITPSLYQRSSEGVNRQTHENIKENLPQIYILNIQKELPQISKKQKNNPIKNEQETTPSQEKKTPQRPADTVGPLCLRLLATWSALPLNTQREGED